jgi:hypothetical protein
MTASPFFGGCRTVDRQEFEVMLEFLLKAVTEQYIMPLTMAVGTLAAAIAARDEELGKAIGERLKEQAESCRRSDAAGWFFLLGLAGIVSDPQPTDPSSVEKAVRTSLRLIHGGKAHGENKLEPPDTT